MHELGIVFHIMDSLESVAKENSLSAISSVTVEVGEVSTVIPDYLTDCWAWAIKKKELLLQCELVIGELEHGGCIASVGCTGGYIEIGGNTQCVVPLGAHAFDFAVDNAGTALAQQSAHAVGIENLQLVVEGVEALFAAIVQTKSDGGVS